jgi:hypothetical protein
MKRMSVIASCTTLIDASVLGKQLATETHPCPSRGMWYEADERRHRATMRARAQAPTSATPTMTMAGPMASVRSCWVSTPDQKPFERPEYRKSSSSARMAGAPSSESVLPTVAAADALAWPRGASLPSSANVHLDVLSIAAITVCVFERVQWRFVLDDRPAPGLPRPQGASAGLGRERRQAVFSAPTIPC